MYEQSDPRRDSLVNSSRMPVWPYRIAAVAFDMDGLMLNTEELYLEVGNTMMLRRGKIYRDEVRRQMIGLPAEKAWQVLIDAEALVETWGELQIECDQIFDQILEKRVQPMAGLLELLDHLDAIGIPKCVATSSSRVFAKKALEFANILHRMDFVVTAEDVPFGKPNPDIYLLASQRMNTTPTQMLVLEDSANGCRAGVNANACVIAVPGDHSRDHDFTGAYHVADTLRDQVIKRLL